MKNLQILLFILSLIFLQFCDINESVNNDNNYPTTIFPLKDDILQNYNNEYKILNSGHICTELNKYGFTEYSLTPCMDRQILRIEITNEDKMIRMAKECIIKNKKYTGITDTSQLYVSSSDKITGCIKCDGSENDIKVIQWRIRFKNQIFRNYEVLNTEFFVFLDNDGVFMLGGNWFPNIYIPSKDRFNLDKAKEVLLNRKITIVCFNNINITISKDNIKESSRKVIIPYEVDNKIELRVTWELFIVDSQGNPVWVVYVDTTTGEIIKEMQLVIC